jgi:hypothetical protein
MNSSFVSSTSGWATSLLDENAIHALPSKWLPRALTFQLLSNTTPCGHRHTHTTGTKSQTANFQKTAIGRRTARKPAAFLSLDSQSLNNFKSQGIGFLVLLFYHLRELQIDEGHRFVISGCGGTFFCTLECSFIDFSLLLLRFTLLSLPNPFLMSLNMIRQVASEKHF